MNLKKPVLCCSWIVCSLILWMTTSVFAGGVVERELLFIGNSYTSANSLHSLYEDLAEVGVPGYANVTTKAVTKGGYKLSQHAADAGTPTQALNALLAEGNGWQAVVLQEQSQVPGFIDADPFQWNQSLSGVQSLNTRIEALGAHTVLMMTWGRRNGDNNNPNLFPNFETMQAALTKGYTQYAIQSSTPARTVYVAPVGEAFEWIYQFHLTQGEDPLDGASLFSRLYTGDGSHPSQLGSALATLVIYATITGRSTATVPWPLDDIDEEDRARLTMATAATVLDTPFEPVELPSGPAHAYPWLKTWAEAAPASISDDVTISSGLERPTALVDAPQSALTSLQIGIEHGEDNHRGAGRVVVAEGGGLVIEGPTVVGVTGDGVIEQLGGEFRTHTLVLAQEEGSTGNYVHQAGALETQSIMPGKGKAYYSMHGGSLRAQAIGMSLSMLAGTWWVTDAGDSTTVEGSLYVEQAAQIRLELSAGPPADPNQATVDADKSAIIRGSVNITVTDDILNGPLHWRDLIVADNIDHTGATIEVTDGGELAFVSRDDGRAALRLTVGVDQPPTPDTEADAGSTAENPPTSDGRSSGEPPPEAGSGGGSNGGCRAGGPPSLVPGLVLIALVWIRTRRRLAL